MFTCRSGQGPSVLWQLVMCLNRTTLEPVACPPGARGGLPACSSEQLQLLPGYPVRCWLHLKRVQLKTGCAIPALVRPQARLRHPPTPPSSPACPTPAPQMAPACSQHVPKTLRHVTLEQPGGLADCLNATGGGGCGLAPATGAPVDAPEAPPADASWLRTCYAYFTRLDVSCPLAAFLACKQQPGSRAVCNSLPAARPACLQANLTACTNSLEWASEQLIVSAGWNPALNPDTVFTAADCTPVCAGIFAVSWWAAMVPPWCRACAAGCCRVPLRLPRLGWHPCAARAGHAASLQLAAPLQNAGPASRLRGCPRGAAAGRVLQRPAPLPHLVSRRRQAGAAPAMHAQASGSTAETHACWAPAPPAHTPQRPVQDVGLPRQPALQHLRARWAGASSGAPDSLWPGVLMVAVQLTGLPCACVWPSLQFLAARRPCWLSWMAPSGRGASVSRLLMPSCTVRFSDARSAAADQRSAALPLADRPLQCKMPTCTLWAAPAPRPPTRCWPAARPPSTALGCAWVSRPGQPAVLVLAAAAAAHLPAAAGVLTEDARFSSRVQPRMARCLAAVERANTSPVTKGADGLWHYAEPVVTAAQCPRECTGVFKVGWRPACVWGARPCVESWAT